MSALMISTRFMSALWSITIYFTANPGTYS